MSYLYSDLAQMYGVSEFPYRKRSERCKRRRWYEMRGDGERKGMMQGQTELLSIASGGNNDLPGFQQQDPTNFLRAEMRLSTLTSLKNLRLFCWRMNIEAEKEIVGFIGEDPMVRAKQREAKFRRERSNKGN